MLRLAQKMTGRFNQLETSNFDISHWFSFFGRGLIFLAFSYQFSSYFLNEPDFISYHLKQKNLAAMYFAVFISNQSTMQILLMHSSSICDECQTYSAKISAMYTLQPIMWVLRVLPFTVAFGPLKSFWRARSHGKAKIFAGWVGHY